MILIPKPNSNIISTSVENPGLIREYSMKLKGTNLARNEFGLFFNYSIVYCSSLKEEEYIIKFNGKEIEVLASSEKGFNNGFITIKNIFKNNIVSEGFELKDSPKYSHRELMIDVARNYFPIDELKKIIYEASMLKLNTIHLHLSDDQGYRLESKKYPKLNEVGDKKFYTFEEIKELVNYSKSIGIDIIPEIDIPGHTASLIAAYSLLGCESEKVEISKGYVGNSQSLCIGDKRTYEFLYGLFEEIMDLFPSKYIHIGADEVDKEPWKKSPRCKEFMKSKGIKTINELESYFIRDISSFLINNGKKVICFNEACKLDYLDSRIIIQHWANYPFDRSDEHEYRVGRRFIGSSTLTNYFDYPYYLVPLDKTYFFDPNIRGKKIENALGSSCHIWTEVISDSCDLEKHIFPRLHAYSESAWTEERNYEDFLIRLKTYLENLTGISYTRLIDIDKSVEESTELIIKYFKNRMNQVGGNKYSFDMVINGLKISLDLIRNNDKVKTLEVAKGLVLKK